MTESNVNGPTDDLVEQINDVILSLPAEYTISREMGIRIAAHTGPDGRPPIEEQFLAMTAAIAKLEKRIVEIEKRL